jgi:hypothetical protein
VLLLFSIFKTAISSIQICFSQAVGIFHFLSPRVLHHMRTVFCALGAWDSINAVSGVGKLPKPLSPPTTCRKWHAQETTPGAAREEEGGIASDAQFSYRKFWDEDEAILKICLMSLLEMYFEE